MAHAAFASELYMSRFFFSKSQNTFFSILQKTVFQFQLSQLCSCKIAIFRFHGWPVAVLSVGITNSFATSTKKPDTVK